MLAGVEKWRKCCPFRRMITVLPLVHLWESLKMLQILETHLQFLISLVSLGISKIDLQKVYNCRRCTIAGVQLLMAASILNPAKLPDPSDPTYN